MLHRQRHVIPILALATAGCLWGPGFFFGKVALDEMPVATMVLFRFAFACAGLLPFIFFDRPRFARGEWGWVLAASVLGVPVQYLIQFKGLSLTTVSHASLMVGTLPMLLAIAAVLFSGEQLHFGGWLALAASTVGAVAFTREARTDKHRMSVRLSDQGVIPFLRSLQRKSKTERRPGERQSCASCE